MSETSTYTVTGMTCAHCVASVTEEISELAGVEAVDVDPRVRPGHRHQQPAPRPRRRAGSRRGSRLRPGMSTPPARRRVRPRASLVGVRRGGRVSAGSSARLDPSRLPRPTTTRTPRIRTRRTTTRTTRTTLPVAEADGLTARADGFTLALADRTLRRRSHAARLHDPHVQRPTAARLHPSSTRRTCTSSSYAVT